MSYDYASKRTVIVLSSRIDPSIALNVAGHLALAAGRYIEDDGLMGRSVLPDASGTPHRGISRYPVIIKKTKPTKIREAVELARLKANLFVADYPQQMLDTGHDDELAAALESVPEEQLLYLGALFYGETIHVDEVCRKFSLWKLE